MKFPLFFSLAISTFGIIPSFGQTNWSQSFQISGNALPPFESGILIPYRITALNSENLGYALDGVSTRLDPRDPESEFDIGYLARFDQDGAPLWSIALDPGSSATSLDLFAVPENSNLFFGTYDEPASVSEKAFRLGLFQGADRSAVFAKRFVTSPTTPHYVEYFAGDKIGVTLDKGATIESVVFDATGQTTFNKAYSSPLFSASLPPLVVQTLARDLLPDQTGYLTAVAQSSFNLQNPESFSNIVTLIPFFTGLDGAVTSSNSFSFETVSPGTIPFPSILADNSVLYRIPATVGGVTIGGTTIPVTHLIKVNANGSLAWSKTVESSSIFAVFPSPDAIYLAGSRPDLSGPGNSNAVVLKINPTTGDIMDQASFASISSVDNATSISSDGTDLYIQIFSIDPFAGQGSAPSGTSTLVKLDGDLDLINAKQYLGTQTISFFAPDDPINNMSRFLFTAHDPTDGSIKSITLNDKLEPLADCNLFASFTPTFGSGVTASDLNVSTAAAGVTASDTQTPFADSSITFSAAPLNITDICSVSRGLTIETASNGTEISLSFPTTVDVTYSLQFTPVLGTPFTTVETVLGTGNNASFTRPIGNGTGFYRVSPPPPAE